MLEKCDTVSMRLCPEWCHNLSRRYICRQTCRKSQILKKYLYYTDQSIIEDGDAAIKRTHSLWAGTLISRSAAGKTLAICGNKFETSSRITPVAMLKFARCMWTYSQYVVVSISWCFIMLNMVPVIKYSKVAIKCPLKSVMINTYHQSCCKARPMHLPGLASHMCL